MKKLRKPRRTNPPEIDHAGSWVKRMKVDWRESTPKDQREVAEILEGRRYV